MKRRRLLKQLAIAASAAMLMPACIADPKKVSVALNSLNVDGDDEELLAALAETLIPETDTPGARTVGAHLFTFVMVDDCVEKARKDQYMRGLRGFAQVCKTLGGKSFMDSSEDERGALVGKIQENVDQLDEDVKVFYNLSRRYILEGYLTSEYYLTKVKPYKLVPGPDFKGCVPVKQKETIA